MLVKTIVVGALKTNCYVAADPLEGSCVVIDPGAQVHTILRTLDAEGLRLRGILLTHGHFDHYGALWPLYERRPATVYFHEADLAPIVNCGPQKFKPPQDRHLVRDGEHLRFGSMEFQVLHCPGHTPGSVAYQCEDCLFTGDTLFRGCCGEYTFPGSNMDDMAASLQKLRTLPGDYRVYPGHLEASTLSWERAHNPFLQADTVLALPYEDEDYYDPGKL